MKIAILALSLLSIVSAHAADSKYSGKGQVTLEGQTQVIEVKCNLNASSKENTVKIGEEVYSIDGNCTKIEGNLKTKVEGKVVADKSLEIYRDAKALEQIKKNPAAVGVENSVKCDASSNAFVVVGNNLTLGISGNCVTLK